MSVLIKDLDYSSAKTLQVAIREREGRRARASSHRRPIVYSDFEESMSAESTGVVVPFTVFLERQARLRRLAASVKEDAARDSHTDTPPPDPGPEPAIMVRELPFDKTR
jgi:hypothetical protein